MMRLYWEDGFASRGFEYRIGVYPLGRNNYPLVPGVCTGIICKTRKWNYLGASPIFTERFGFKKEKRKANT
jgi:hypothetical protein